MRSVCDITLDPSLCKINLNTVKTVLLYHISYSCKFLMLMYSLSLPPLPLLPSLPPSPPSLTPSLPFVVHNYHVGVIYRHIFAHGQFQRHGHYNSEIFGDFRSSFHIPASVKSQIIHSHYKAVTMDSASYEVEINCLNQL